MKQIVKMQFGSHLYGTDLPSSDHDYKVIFVPDPKDIILGKVRESYNQTTKKDIRSKNTDKDFETEFFSFKKYLELLIEGQTVALDMLFAPDKFYLESPDNLWYRIKENKDKFLHNGILSFIGYARKQAAKYGIKGSRVAAARHAVEFFSKYPLHVKLSTFWDEIISTFGSSEHCEFSEDYMRGNPEHKVRMLSVCNRKVQEHITVKEALKIYKHIFDEYGQRALLAETNEGIDWKALMHAVRVTEEGNELLLTGNITFPRPEAKVLLAIRQGQMPYKEVAEFIEEGMDRLIIAQENSILPKEPDKQFMEDMIYNCYLEHIENNS